VQQRGPSQDLQLRDREVRSRTLVAILLFQDQNKAVWLLYFDDGTGISIGCCEVKERTSQCRRRELSAMEQGRQGRARRWKDDPSDLQGRLRRWTENNLGLPRLAMGNH